jgi:hypothetical protein
MLARGAQSVASTNMLAQAGLVGDAMSCSRTIVEMAIDFAYVEMDAAVRIERFMAHDNTGHRPDGCHGQLQRQRDDFRDNYEGSLTTWSGRRVDERAAKCDRLALYRLSYRDQCNAGLHSGPGALEYTVDSDRRIRFGVIEPETHPVVLVLIGDAVVQCNLDTTIGDRVEPANERVRAIVDRAREQR